MIELVLRTLAHVDRASDLASVLRSVRIDASLDGKLAIFRPRSRVGRYALEKVGEVVVLFVCNEKEFEHREGVMRRGRGNGIGEERERMDYDQLTSMMR